MPSDLDHKMSLQRRWYALQRFFRHRSILFSFFMICLMVFVFAIAFYHDSPEEIGHDHLDHAREMHRNIFGDGSRKKFDIQRRNVDIYADDDDGVLPGEADPETVFKNGVLGNFESAVAQPRPGKHGEMGEPVNIDLNSPEAAKAMRDYGFNTHVSDMISMNRSVPDVRMEECKYWHYPEDLPTASVVIVFHNEGWSPLLRTVHSVLLRSPPQFIKEILLVDDYSDKPHLKEELEKYIEQFDGKVKLIRNKDREGLIRTRSIGAQQATGDVVIFLDAHCEVNINWLPPLLAPIRRNRKVMTVPVIDGIDMNTWAYRRVYGSADRHFRGIFEWGLLYKETEISPQEKSRRAKNSEPFRSPTHAGGLFAIDRKWFEELGYYDPGLQIWGGEQYELSFKIWQCGGGILFVPCSHVGHVYRSHMPYSFGKLTGKPVISTNMVRVIKTWMDEYEKYYYIREPSAKHRKPGDISAQLDLRKRLHCKSFRWYMDKVAYDVPKSYPFLPENQVWGEAKNLQTSKCIDAAGHSIPGRVIATSCHGYGGNQLLRLNAMGQLTQGEWCITPVSGRLQTNHCVKGTVNGPFAYDEATKQIRYKPRDTCLAVNASFDKDELSLKDCDAADELQKWQWREIFTD